MTNPTHRVDSSGPASDAVQGPAFETSITRLFGITHPILCGGLMWLADARYVAAAVNAGGMGFITARTFPDPGAFRAELQACRALTAGRPFWSNAGWASTSSSPVTTGAVASV